MRLKKSQMKYIEESRKSVSNSRFTSTPQSCKNYGGSTFNKSFEWSSKSMSNYRDKQLKQLKLELDKLEMSKLSVKHDSLIKKG